MNETPRKERKERIREHIFELLEMEGFITNKADISEVIVRLDQRHKDMMIVIEYR